MGVLYCCHSCFGNFRKAKVYPATLLYNPFSIIPAYFAGISTAVGIIKQTFSLTTVRSFKEKEIVFVTVKYCVAVFNSTNNQFDCYEFYWAEDSFANFE